MGKKTVLGIDTATLTASVAIIRGSEVLATGESSVNTHSQRLIGLVDEALASAGLTLGELDGIAIGAGPGSFTGLRIGMATAKGLAFATGTPLWAVSSLAAMALSARATWAAQEERARVLITPILDARRSEIFAGFYRLADPPADRGEAEAEEPAEAVVEAVSPEQVLAPADLGAALERALAASGCTRALALGDGIERYRDELDRVATNLAPTVQLTWIAGADTPPAAAVALLAASGEQRDLVIDGAPSYIRLSEAEIKYPDGNPGGAFKNRAGTPTP